MNVKQIADIIEKVAPVTYASDWDNVGLMIGSYDSEVTKILVTLDVTADIVSQAVKNNCDMIISHHPLLFKGLKTIDFTTETGRILRELIKNNISVYSCHTNMDAANGGINSFLAEMFELKKLEVLENHPDFTEIGIGRIGILSKEISFDELCMKTKELLKTPFLRVITTDNKKTISKICVASGSCGDLIVLAAAKGADVIITSDVKYHQGLEANELGISVIDAGHFPTEYIVLNIFSEILKSAPVEIVYGQAVDVFNVI